MTQSAVLIIFALQAISLFLSAENTPFVEVNTSKEQIEIQSMGKYVERILETILDPPQDDLNPNIEMSENALNLYFRRKWVSVVGVKTFNSSEEGDVLMLRWMPDHKDSRIKDLWLWDGPKFVIFLLETDRSRLSSEQDYKKFFSEIFVQPRRIMFTILQGQAGDVTGFGRMEEVGPSDPSIEGYGFGIQTITISGRSFLSCLIGKRKLREAYDENSVFIPERFPPLKDRITGADKSTLIKQLGKTMERNQILFSELIRQGVTFSEFESILFKTGLSNYDVGNFIKAIHEHNKGIEYGSIIRKVVISPDLYDKEVFDYFVGALLSIQDVDFSKEIIAVLEKGFAARGGFRYLQFRANSQEILERLKKVPVSNERENEAKMAALRAIQCRLFTPTVEIISPKDGTTVFSGTTISITVMPKNAPHALNWVQLFIGGRPCERDDFAPFGFTFIVPSKVASVRIRALAASECGSIIESKEIKLNVVASDSSSRSRLGN